jgi:3alpha(or 20beta)-hydroxysteroid dehydrogenase
MSRVAGKVVVVTGAAGGQGAAEAAALVQEGATVVATDVHDDAATAAGAVYRRLDVSRSEDWAALAAYLAEEHGSVDGLVNNAGVAFRARLEEVDPADWERVLAVNLTGPLYGIRAVAPLMPAGGSIVNVASIAALGGYHAVAYTVSKWGLRGLSRVACLELGPRGIRVNTILPGFVETAMTAGAPPVFRTANVAATPLGRTGAPDEVAPLVVYLISDESSFVSGAEIAVDGGQSAVAGTKAFSDAIREESGA